ncbi:GNAT family N-acetyltransferase [Nocardioides sp. GY 10113]|uniref:GNAT family N-acetyltransferase n=1 Tax=Nocardioides sp. GY 10113 TaxID=2569761 RepID=UPI0010A795C0|nr:GNAT family N-acetyltransferase [Nocardioides sp. GY 10113]TIC87426.1 GNAT family N-acetyltransferase [Nocardioides sp. GY 10113]
MVTVTFLDDPARFLEQAGPTLAAHPASATVVATVAERLARPGAARSAPFCWFAVVEPDRPGEEPGLAIRTHPAAPHPPYVLPMPEASAVALADALVDRGEPVGAVNGSRPAADVLAARIVERRGGTVEVGVHMRLFELGALVPPRTVPGRLRAVRPEEDELALAWLRRFFADADEQAGRTPGDGHTAVESFTLADVERKRDDGTLWFWVDDEDRPVHLTGANPPAFGVARVGPVFTPVEERGRGWASAAVAEVSALLRDAGHRVILFADQANAVSNGIYLALGYEAVEDTVELAILPA